VDPIFLSRPEAEAINEASLTVLEQTGLRLEHPEALSLLLEAGAQRDPDGRVLVPRQLVQDALERVGRGFTLHARTGEPALELVNGRTYFGPGSDALCQMDLASGKPRDSVLEDVGINARLADALGFDFVMSMALPREVGAPHLYPRVTAQMVRSTTRPIVATAATLDDVVHIHRIAAIAVGGEQALAERPYVLFYLEPLSPLHFDQTSMARLLYCADHRLPFVFAPGANCGIGAPITPEGGVVQGNAESLAGLLIALLRSPDVRYVYGANTSSADMRSAMVCYGSPEWSRTVGMYADLGQLFDLPTWGTAGCTDAHEVDAQAAWEAYRGILLAVQTRPTLVHDMGYMAFGELFDPRMLALSAEMLEEARHLMQPVDLSEEALSTSVIDEVARSNGLYLAHPATRKSYRKALWISKLINRNKLGLDSEALVDRLGRRVGQFASTHTPVLLAPEVEREIEGYLGSI